MKRKNGKFTSEFKDEAVSLALSGEKSIVQTARDLGLGASTLQNWVSKYKKRDEAPTPEGSSYFQLAEENRKLREENRRLQMERDVLKKATAFFATENK